ncbi:TGB1 [Senna mosaic virus]|uniref:TGB1 n=1 Tax=Senna mosaic virus TaxID=1881013 RepID=A0A1B1V3J2_9VIRU|nr:TGB1 [Senna mosaic virus]ANW11493.1 TGB1 [Senna mosaic virus]
MNHFINALTEGGFERTKVPISEPLVVHAVAGSGKTSLVRSFIKDYNVARAYTHGVPDPQNLEGKFIQAYKQPNPTHFNILDEYCAEPLTSGWQVVLADPLQHRGTFLEPHYIKRVSHRIPKSTEEILEKAGFQIKAVKEAGVCSHTGIFEGPLRGKLITLDRTVQDLLVNHGLSPSCPTEVLGQEFPVVTLFSSSPLNEVKAKHLLYIALTRHTKELHVRAPPFSHTTP